MGYIPYGEDEDEVADVETRYGEYYTGGARTYSGHSYGYGYSYNYDNYDFSRFGGNYYSTDLNENKLMVKKPTGYATPDKNDIEHKLRVVGHVSTENNETLVGDLARFFYYQMLEEPDYFKDDALDLTCYSETEVKKHQMLYNVLQDLWAGQTPGFSPLDKAVNAFVAMANQKSDGSEPKLQIDMLGEGLLQIKEDVFRDATYNDLLDKAEVNPAKRLAILQKISLIQDFGTEFKVEKEVIDKIASNSQLTAQRIMRDYSQLHMVEAYQRLLPNYHLKLLNKDLVVKVHVERVENKQKIIIIVDFSGSMKDKEKQEWVMALMVDRLKYVIKGEAEVFFSYFVCEPSALKFHHLHDAASALAFWKKFSTSPNGGGTNIGAIIDYIGSEIRRGKLHNLAIDLSQQQPEILIINDGQDRIHTSEFTHKTNAVTLLQDNPQLKELCKENRGKYVHITQDQKVVYS